MIEAAMAAIVVSGTYIYAADATNPWVPTGIAGVSFLAVLGLLAKIQKGYVAVQDRKIALTQLEAKEAKLGEAVCEWRINRITEFLRTEMHIGVPDDIWEHVPKYLTDQQERLAEQRNNLNA